MTTDIFIRTYEKDLEWLKYCLRSIHKYATGYRDIIVCIPETQKKLLDNWNLTAEKIVTCPVYKEDYLGQQVSKIEAYKYSNAECIVFIDSDCHFTRKTNLQEEIFENGKPILYKTRYERVGDAIVWKGITENTVGAEVAYEYMRRMPMVFMRRTLQDASLFIRLKHDKEVSEYVMSQPGRHFSEFNYLGAFADINENDLYVIKDTEKEGCGNDYIKQKWSWGGITGDIKKELEEAGL
jgi:glycosyltransferase involved in cell wall biosynthesis